MVKTFKANKCHKKPKISRRISKKIKFIRHSSKIKNIIEPESPKSKSTIDNTIKRENEINFEYSLLNWSFIFLQQKSCPKRNNKQFIREFINIIKNLCINRNEFISWTLYIDYFQSCRKISWDLETLLYIGIYTKTKFNNNTFNNYGITINNEKMNEINSILDNKNINLIFLLLMSCDISELWNFFMNKIKYKVDNINYQFILILISAIERYYDKDSYELKNLCYKIKMAFSYEFNKSYLSSADYFIEVYEEIKYKDILSYSEKKNFFENKISVMKQSHAWSYIVDKKYYEAINYIKSILMINI